MEKDNKRFISKRLNKDDFDVMSDFLGLLANKFNLLDNDSMMYEQSWEKTKEGVNTYIGGQISGKVN